MTSNDDLSHTLSDRFSNFLKSYGVISAGLIGAAGTPLIAWLLKIVPPSPPAPNNLQVFSILLSLPIFIGSFVYLKNWTKRLLKITLLPALFALSFFSALYFHFYTTKTIPWNPNPTLDSRLDSDLVRIVIGDDCSDDAKKLNPKECAEPETMRSNPDLLLAYSSNKKYPGNLWDTKSIQRNSDLLLVLWFAIILVLNFCLCTMVSLVADS